MKWISQVFAFGAVALSLGLLLGTTGCGSPTSKGGAPGTMATDKMDKDKMDKMPADKMTADKMDKDKMEKK